MDVWGYHHARLYADASIADQLILATAPTGRFNALAIEGNGQMGILLEDGLLYFAREITKLLGDILYTRDNGDLRIVDVGPSLDDRIIEKSGSIDRLLDATLSYLVDGYIRLPEPDSTDLDEEEESAVHAVIFQAFIVFVIEHELHHLLAKRQGIHILASSDESFEKNYGTTF